MEVASERLLCHQIKFMRGLVTAQCCQEEPEKAALVRLPTSFVVFQLHIYLLRWISETGVGETGQVTVSEQKMSDGES